jgi:peptidoglycan-associated lipoprotein
MRSKYCFSVLCLLVVLCGGMFSCSRDSSQVWEDTKTGGNYMGRGFKAVAGKHDDSRQVASQKDFKGPTYDEEYIPIDNDDLYQRIVLGDEEAKKEINAYSAIPQAKDSPGDIGSIIPGIEGFVNPKDIGLQTVFQTIHFDTDTDVVRGSENRLIIKSIADYLKVHPDTYIFVEGHCDRRATAAYNLSLGSRRSNSVRALLIREGVDLERLFTITYGKERPISLEDNAKSWSVNRRAQFKLYIQQ